MGVQGAFAAAGRVLDGARGVARVFRADASQGAELDHGAHRAALEQFHAEFGGASSGFDRVVNGLNRLPRPFLAFGTLGLFVYAMVEPLGFAKRMQGLSFVPEPLWWLLGAIVGFYFGARELHYLRVPAAPEPRPDPVQSSWHHSDAETPEPKAAEPRTSEPEASEPRTAGRQSAGADPTEAETDNPALAAWRAGA